MECVEIVYSSHAVQRMFERGISESDVSGVINSGEVIDSYPDDTPLPSQLVLDFIGGKPLHVVLGVDEQQKSDAM